MRAFKAPPVNDKLAGEFSTIINWLKKSATPLYLEIGCGVGLHPIKFAKSNPQFRLLAFERTSEKFNKAHQRFINNGSPENLLIIHGDASFFIDELFLNKIKSPALDGVFILYPNPYPKNSQANLRLAHMPLTHALAKALKINGTLVLASNKSDYIDEAHELIPQKTPLKILKKRRIDAAETPRTHFEKKYLGRGEDCFELIFTRK
ncbi:MAG: SAM-dependent methyltransferase [Bdellovibrionota bacterium]